MRSCTVWTAPATSGRHQAGSVRTSQVGRPDTANTVMSATTATVSARPGSSPREVGEPQPVQHRQHREGVAALQGETELAGLDPDRVVHLQQDQHVRDGDEEQRVHHALAAAEAADRGHDGGDQQHPGT